MNEADPTLLNNIIQSLNQINSSSWHCPHRLRVIRSGSYHHIDLHITVPNYWTLTQGHCVEKEVARALLEAMGKEGDVMIHLDPCRPYCCSCCPMKACPIRSSAYQQKPPWTLENIIAHNPNCPSGIQISNG